MSFNRKKVKAQKREPKLVLTPGHRHYHGEVTHRATNRRW